MLPPPRRSKPVPSVIPRKSKTPPLSFRGGCRPTKESTLHSASLPGNKPFVTSGFRLQLQQISLSFLPQIQYPLWSSTANAGNRPWSSFCPPTRQRFRPFRSLCRTRLQPYGPQGHIFRICVLASSLAARNGKSTVPQCFHLRGVEPGTLDNDLLSPSPLSYRHSQSLSSCHSEKVKDRLFVIPRRSQTDEGLFPTFRLSIHQACRSSMQKDLTYNNLQNIKPQAFRISDRPAVRRFAITWQSKYYRREPSRPSPIGMTTVLRSE
jgi:hypothetical protein